MLRTKIILLVILILAGIMLSGCDSLESDWGSIAGAVFYAGEEVRVGGAWVRLYDSTGETILAETQVDSQARFFFSIPAGSYLIRGSSTYAGIYSGPDDLISVWAQGTRTVYFSIDEDPPES